MYESRHEVSQLSSTLHSTPDSRTSSDRQPSEVDRSRLYTSIHFPIVYIHQPGPATDAIGTAQTHPPAHRTLQPSLSSRLLESGRRRILAVNREASSRVRCRWHCDGGLWRACWRCWRCRLGTRCRGRLARCGLALGTAVALVSARATEHRGAWSGGARERVESGR